MFLFFQKCQPYRCSQNVLTSVSFFKHPRFQPLRLLQHQWRTSQENMGNVTLVVIVLPIKNQINIIDKQRTSKGVINSKRSFQDITSLGKAWLR